MANKNNGVASRVFGYVQGHLAEACKDYNDIVGELQENVRHPDRNHRPKERIAFLQKLADGDVKYIEQIIKDLKRLK